MRKTLNINLNGQAFCIDEDACYKLQAYIETLEKHYLKEEGGKEIMSDIENRIAELLRETLQKKAKDVVTLEDIKSVVEVMGTPDAIIDEDSETTATQPIRRKLYRDPDHTTIGGVASGIAAYLDISSAWIRILFVVLAFFYGITIVVYIILWIALPLATTPKQKMEMKGETMNIPNIEKNVRKTYENVKKNSKLQNTVSETGKSISSFFSATGQVIRNILNILLSILAVLGIVAGIFLILLSCWLILFPTHFTPDYYYTFFRYAVSPVSVGLIKIVLLLLINIPLFLIVYYSIIHFIHSDNHKPVLLISGSIWFIACLSGIFISIYQTTRFAQGYRSETTLNLQPADTTNRSLHVRFEQLHNPELFGSIHCSLSNYLLYSPENNDSSLYLRPEVQIEPTGENWPSVSIVRLARGYSEAEALQNTNAIQYRYTWKNDTLNLSNYFSLNDPRWRMQQVYLKIRIPDQYIISMENPYRNNFNSLNLFNNPQQFLYDLSSRSTYRMQNGQLEKLEDYR